MNQKLILAALLSSTALSASAQDVELDEIIIGNTRTETPVDDATQSVSVITSDEISQQTTVNTMVSQVLAKTVAGFTQDNASVSDYGQQLRGQNFQVLIDGVPQSNLSYFTGRSLNTINPAALEQIEIVRGATAAYGFGAPGGLINLVTKRPQSGETKNELSFGVRLQPTELSETFSFNTAFTTQGATEDSDYLLSFAVEKTGSSFDPDGNRRPPDVVGRQGAIDDAQNFNILAKFGRDLERGRAELSFSHYDYQQDSDWAGDRVGGNKATDTAAVPLAGDPSTVQPGAVNTVINAKYTAYDVFGGDMELQAYYTENDTIFAAVTYFGYTYPGVQNISEKLGARLTFDTPLSDALNIVWGLDAIQEKTTNIDIDTTDLTPDFDVTGLAAFAQVNWSPSDRFNFTAGARAEQLSVDIPTYQKDATTTVTGGTVDYSDVLINASASYEFDEMFTVFGGYSEGLEINALSRFLRDNPITDVAELSDRGQATKSYELGFRGENGRFDYSVTGFISQNENGSTYDSGLNLILAEEEIKGVELAANYQINDQFQIGGTYTYVEGQWDSDADGILDTDLGSDRVAPPKLTAYLAYTPNQRSNYRVDVVHSGTRDPNGVTFTDIETITAYTTVDLTANFQLGSGVLSLGVQNLFNTDYANYLTQSYSVPIYYTDYYYYVKGQGRTVSANYSVDF